MSNSSLLKEIKKNKSEVFRRAYIKRMLGSGQYEDDWVEITNDVKKWGKITKEIDGIRRSKINFSSANLTLANDEGKYNPQTDENSLWLGYANRQRTLIKIEAGFVHVSLGASGIWLRDEYPHTEWDVDLWDGESPWDVTAQIFTGIVYGDITQSDKNEVQLQIMPTVQVFRDYPARNIIGYNNSLTASEFIGLLRDQTDGAGSFVFRPFFNDWDISTTTNEFGNLSTSGAEDVIDSTVWDVVEKLCEVENFVAYTNIDNDFRFVSRAANTSSVAFEFYGAGTQNRTYGHTIKSIGKYGPKVSKYYSRVEVKYVDADTTTSYEVMETTLTVAGDNNAWVYGHKTFQIENFWIPNSTVAQTIATNVFNEVNALKNEIEFSTSFVPHIDVLDKVSVTYDSSAFNADSIWDQRNWGDDTPTVLENDLLWDSSRGDAIKLNGAEFNCLKIAIDLDKFETSFILREG